MEVANGEARSHTVHQPKEQPSFARWLFSAAATKEHGSSDNGEPDSEAPSEGSNTFRDESDTTGHPIASDMPTSESSAIPPYWGHFRKESRSSQTSTDLPRKPIITLEDHTENSAYDANKGLWAKSVSVDDYHVVNGKSGIGAYVVWTCRIETLSVRQTL